jgi:hypothetical protein
MAGLSVNEVINRSNAEFILGLNSYTEVTEDILTPHLTCAGDTLLAVISPNHKRFAKKSCLQLIHQQQVCPLLIKNNVSN